MRGAHGRDAWTCRTPSPDTTGAAAPELQRRLCRCPDSSYDCGIGASLLAHGCPKKRKSAGEAARIRARKVGGSGRAREPALVVGDREPFGEGRSKRLSGVGMMFERSNLDDHPPGNVRHGAIAVLVRETFHRDREHGVGLSHDEAHGGDEILVSPLVLAALIR